MDEDKDQKSHPAGYKFLHHHNFTNPWSLLRECVILALFTSKHPSKTLSITSDKLIRRAQSIIDSLISSEIMNKVKNKQDFAKTLLTQEDLEKKHTNHSPEASTPSYVYKK
jgi:hypothetical protein